MISWKFWKLSYPGKLIKKQSLFYIEVFRCAETTTHKYNKYQKHEKN